MLVKTQPQQDTTRVGKARLTRHTVAEYGRQDDLASLISTIFISCYLHMREFTVAQLILAGHNQSKRNFRIVIRRAISTAYLGWRTVDGYIFICYYCGY